MLNFASLVDPSCSVDVDYYDRWEFDPIDENGESLESIIAESEDYDVLFWDWLDSIMKGES